MPVTGANGFTVTVDSTTAGPNGNDVMRLDGMLVDYSAAAVPASLTLALAGFALLFGLRAEETHRLRAPTADAL